MKILDLFSLALLALPLACSKPAESPPKAEARKQQAESVAEDVDSDNLLNVAVGASVVSRTGEGNLDLSAAHAIDGLHATFWSSPPGGTAERLTFALATPSRIEKIGITTMPYSPPGPVSVQFEASADGKSWRKIAVIDIQSKDVPQITSVPQFDAAFIRVGTVAGARYYTYFRSVHAIGKELAPPAPRNFAGCWMLNGARSRIAQEGAHLRGVIETSPPTWFDGGSDGRFAKVMWMRGPTWGYAALAISPEMQTISGPSFFHMVSPYHLGPAWIGKRCDETSAVASAPDNLPERLLKQAGKWSMHGLVFNERDQLLEEPSRATLDSLTRLLRDSSQRLRVVAHEVREADQEHNRSRSAARNAALRAALQKRGIDTARTEFVAAGGERDGTIVVSSIQRAMVSRIDVEVIR